LAFEIIILLVIVSAAFILFIGSRLRVDVVGLLVLSALALTGLVTAQEALAGFSSPAVVALWALFILSAGLTRTGIAHQIGQPLQRLAKGSEATLMVALMLVASLLSALINTVTVAAILLPSTMELARRSGRPPSRLLMPLALGCLLGGPFTGISTPPNILVTDALRIAGLRPFAIFDFTPITAAIVVAGIAFMVLIGRHLLPSSSPGADDGSRPALGTSYQLDTHIFTTGIPKGSPLDGRTLAESRLGSALYLTVLALQRKGVLILAPRPKDILQSGDTLIVHGSPHHLQRIHASQHLQVESPDLVRDLLTKCLYVAEGIVTEDSPLLGSTLAESALRREHRVHVVALHCPIEGEVKDLRRHQLVAGERLLLQGERESLEELSRLGFVTELRLVDEDKLKALAGDRTKLLPVRVPPGSVLAGHDLVESRLGNAFGLTVVGLVRGDEMFCMPSPNEKVQAGDLLVLQGSPHDLEVLEGLQELEIAEQSSSLVSELESQQIGVTEAQIIPTAALVVLMAPVALSTAASLGISPHLLMMTVAISASSSFASPLSHPAHLLVMGPGGYRFIDYVKVGVPITIISLLLSVGLLPILWPPYG
jgi:di/tricarboxylate transporter